MKNTESSKTQSIKDNDRSSRLREVLRYVGYVYGVKSARAFAMSVGVTQRMMAFYLKGDNTPSKECCEKVCRVYPDFYFEWLYDGEEPKYNPEYVKISDPSSPDQNTTSEPMSIDATLKLYLSSLKSRIAKAMKCPTPEEIKQRLQDIVEELEEAGR